MEKRKWELGSYEYGNYLKLGEPYLYLSLKSQEFGVRDSYLIRIGKEGFSRSPLYGI